MNTTIHAIINKQQVKVEVSAAEILYTASKIENALHEATQNIVVFAADAYNWRDGRTVPSIGIRKVNRVGGNEFGVIIDDGLNYLIAGTLRRIDNDQEIVRLRDLMSIGYSNAYIELRGQAMCMGALSTPELGKRKIVDMQMIGERAYLTLAPIA